MNMKTEYYLPRPIVRSEDVPPTGPFTFVKVDRYLIGIGNGRQDTEAFPSFLVRTPSQVPGLSAVSAFVVQRQHGRLAAVALIVFAALLDVFFQYGQVAVPLLFRRVVHHIIVCGLGRCCRYVQAFHILWCVRELVFSLKSTGWLMSSHCAVFSRVHNGHDYGPKYTHPNSFMSMSMGRQ